MKYELKSIGYWSLIKISFVVNLVIGFIVGLGMALLTGIMFSFAGRLAGITGAPILTEEMPSIGFLLIFYPIMGAFGAGVFNTILYVIIAFVYNVISRLVGGVELEFSEVRPQPISYPAQQPSQAYPQPPQPPIEQVRRPPPPPPPPPVEPLPPDLESPAEEENNDEEQL